MKFFRKVNPVYPVWRGIPRKRISPSSGVLIDAGNLHEGGALQVGASLITEMGAMVEDGSAPRWLRSSKVRVSKEVWSQLGPSSKPLHIEVVEARKLRNRFSLSYRSATVLQVFGPRYVLKRPALLLSGYADVTAVFGFPAGTSSHRRLLGNLRGLASRFLVSRSDVIIVESDYFRSAAQRRLRVKSTKIEVVSNSLNQEFLKGLNRADPAGRQESETVRIGYVARAYPHKNHRFLGQLAARLEAEHGWKVEFLLTLTQEEFDALDSDTKRYSTNFGILPLAELPGLYRSMDLFVFPSLLESYSASPLEAQACGVPVAVSDREFMRAVLKDSVAYFDPLDPASAAAVLSPLLDSRQARQRLVDLGFANVSVVPSSRYRAESFVEAMSALLSRKLWTE